jgi:hypothetical protein
MKLCRCLGIGHSKLGFAAMVRSPEARVGRFDRKLWISGDAAYGMQALEYRYLFHLR